MNTSDLLRRIPSVTELLDKPALKPLVDRVSHSVVVESARSLLDDLRVELKRTADQMNVPSATELAERIARRILQGEQPKLAPVINATGILLHTGLGRAPLAEEAIQEIAAVARGYASVELDLVTGQRSQRNEVVSELLRQVTGAEASLVVNNNAGATMLALAAIASGKEVIVARGQLVEIGGSYRLPDVMETSGAQLREVGTTNKVRGEDYDQAIGENTGAILRVHPSNFRVIGFTQEVELPELVRIGREHSVPVVDDIGSGALLDFAEFGAPGEPLAQQSLANGADLVLMSGDKLLGGPQCGIILGKKEYVNRCIRHPLARALRVDKLTLAALSATLRLYRDPEKARQKIPLLRLAATAVENLQNRAERLAPQFDNCSAIASAEPRESVAFLGGGSLPTQQIPTWTIAITPQELSAERFAQKLRSGSPAVVGRIQNDQVLLDLRSVFPDQDGELVAACEKMGTDSAASDTPEQ